MGFERNGWELLRGIFNHEAEEVSVVVPAITATFCKKYLKEIDHDALTFDQQIVSLGQANPKLLFELNGRISNLPVIKRIASSEKAVEIFSNFSGVDPKFVYAQGNANFLINTPSQKRLQYSWHTAFQGYPKRSCFINFWLPLMRGKTPENGTLQIANCSHKFLFPAIEGKHIARDGAKSSLTQFRVPDQFVDRFEIESVVADPGDVAIMHPLLLHSSSDNLSNKPSYVFIFKIWSDISDFSLSSKLDNRMYDESNDELIIPTVIDTSHSMTRDAVRLY